MNISVVGLGKLGAPLAAVLASKGNSVIGVDVAESLVSILNQGKPPVPEPGLDELIALSRVRLRATQDYVAAIGETDVTFIVVPTPSDAEGAFSLQYVLDAIDSVGKALRTKETYHLVVITSTIMPGDMDTHVLPALERRSGKRCGDSFGLCYSPEFIALGTVIRDMLNPDFALIGEFDTRSGDILEGIYRNTCDNDPQIARMNFVNAELAKLAVNTFVTTKISYANMLAGICEKLPGANVDAVTSAVGLDSRIGRKYLKAATAYGGPCFPRDNAALAHLGRKLGSRAILAEATDELNRRQTTHLADLVLSSMPTDGRVGILGLTYKPQTRVVEESAGLNLAKHFVARKVPTVVYDPVAHDNAKRCLDGNVHFASSIAEFIRQVDAVVITTPRYEFRDVLAHATKPLVILDCWRYLDDACLSANIQYLQVGVGQVQKSRESAAATA
jgi:UDPglucose 6-dehydrogenase